MSSLSREGRANPRPSLDVRAYVTIANNKVKGEPHNCHEGSMFPTMIQGAGTPGRLEGNAKGLAEGAKDAIVRLV